MKYILLFVAFIAHGVISMAQHSKPDTLTAYRINSAMNFDGKPNDAVWDSVQHISNFTQRELHFGEPASEKTESAKYFLHH